MKLFIIWFVLLFSSAAFAQQANIAHPFAPCVAFGSASGTCAQGNDARLGAGAITGAVKSNGSNSFSQAACADLSNAGGGCTATLGASTAGSNSTTILGVSAGAGPATGINNTAIGNFALAILSSGVNNTALGQYALGSISTTSYNTAIGVGTLYDVTGGFYNTAIGNETGRGIVNGSYNTIIGASVSGLSSSLANAVILADGQGNIRFDYGQTTASTNTITGALAVTGLTNVATTSAVCFNTSTKLITYDSTLGTCTTSTLRSKDLISQLSPKEGFEIVMKMEPWRYTLKKGLPTYQPGEEIGMVADYAEKVEPRLVAMNPDGTTGGFRYEQYTAALTAAIKYQQECLDNWKCRIFGIR